MTLLEENPEVVGLNWSVCFGEESPNGQDRFDYYDGTIFPTAIIAGTSKLETWNCIIDNYQKAIDGVLGTESIVDVYMDFTDSENLILSTDITFSADVAIECKVIFVLSCWNPGGITWDNVVIDSSVPMTIDQTFDGMVNHYEYQFDPQILDLYEMEYNADNYHAVTIVQEWDSKKILQVQEIAVGTVDNQENVAETPAYKLEQNYPNPINLSQSSSRAMATIPFSIEKSANVKIDIFNIKGQKINSLTNRFFEKGEHEVVWNGQNRNNQDVSAGIYFYKFQTNDFVDMKRIVIIK